MMNNQYNATANLTTPHGIQMTQHVAATTHSMPLPQSQQQQQASAAVLNTYYNGQQQQHHHHHHQSHTQPHSLPHSNSQHLLQHHQQLIQQQPLQHQPQNVQHQHQTLQPQQLTAGNLYGDPRQQQQLPVLPVNALDKTYYTTAAAGGALGTPQRFYTTTTANVSNTAVASTTQPSTILITNNFAHHQHQHPTATQNSGDQQRAAVAALNHPNNIRIVSSSSGNSSQILNTSTSPPGNYQQHTQQVFSLGNAKTLQQLFPQHLLQQQQPSQQQNFHQSPSDLISHQFPSHQNYPIAGAPAPLQGPLQMSQYYVANTADSPQLGTSNNKLNLSSTEGSNSNSSPLNTSASTPSTNPSSSTVVLDRINICINNLYTDTTSTSTSSSTSNSLASTPAPPQQPSPIIPAIQHKAIIDNGNLPLMISSSSSPTGGGGDVYDSGVLVIDEPDSTTTATTPHTPPTTPENTPPCSGQLNNCNNNNNNNSNNNISTTSNVICSPSTSSTNQMGPFNNGKIKKTDMLLIKQKSFANVKESIEKVAAEEYTGKNSQTPTTTMSQQQTTSTATTPLTPPTPPSPKKPEAVVDLTEGSSIIKSRTILEKPTSLLHSEKKQTSNLESYSASPSPGPPLFNNGEDVFIKRLDGRFYLGTVIEKSYAFNQYLIRFDDKTEQWCRSDEMRKLGAGGGGGSSTNNSNSNANTAEAMCVACKQQDANAKVEICERCGRGYHRHCTKETRPDSKVWICKRCDKPMKLNMPLGTGKLDLAASEYDDDDADSEIEAMVISPPKKFSYDVSSLTWDSKHRVNEEQIYCYCGKPGKFDHNMLQCCQCLNWFHIQCSRKFKGSMLRGDSFFVFSCSVCNNGGEEYLRRLQMDWTDLAHLILYNLSTMKKRQNHKYHHLLKDIFPYAIEKRKEFPINKEFLQLTDNEFLNKIHLTLKEKTERFIWGKEIKRDHFFFALRTNGPPMAPKICLKNSENSITDHFLINVLQLKLLPEAPENSDVLVWPPLKISKELESASKNSANSHDIYAFDDTSDDEEIPIKMILDKVKNKNRSANDEISGSSIGGSSLIKTITLGQMDVEDDNASDSLLTVTETQKDSPSKLLKNENKLSPKKDSYDNNNKATSASTTVNVSRKASRKRKGFKESHHHQQQHRLFDSTTSDENSSSSSRGTSLDLIIPPPKNFLGQNNPFLIASPIKKKNDSMQLSSHGGGSKKSVSFGIFDSNALNFSSKLAALKSAGLFPKLSTSNLAKAAGQPRTVRTIKRRLSAKDITIGPNQEVRRRRTRRLSANIEVISTTTINPLPTNFFPIHAKDLLAAAAASTSNSSVASLFNTPATTTTIINSSPPPSTVTTKPDDTNKNPITTSSHGRRLRQRPPKCSNNNSRRSSVSSNQSSSSSTAIGTQQQQHYQQQQQQRQSQSHEDLKQTVNKYFGIVNRIESGEQFSICAKRQLANGQMQYLIEWGEPPSSSSTSSTLTTTTLTSQKDKNTIDSIDKKEKEQILFDSEKEERNKNLTNG